MTASLESRAPRRFRPERHSRELLGILREIEAYPAQDAPDARALDAILRRYPREGKGFFSRSQLIAGFRYFAAREGSVLDAEDLARKLRLRPVRTHSGVTPLSVLTKPYPCPGRCIFCPSDVRMPRSYLSAEPGAQRAAQNDFDPYLQTWNRLAALRAIGHPTDKIELIVLGGTWSFYPEAYQVGFIARCLEALNDFGRGRDRRAQIPGLVPDFRKLGDGEPTTTYNRQVSAFLSREQAGVLVPERERSRWEVLHRAQRENEHAACRCVGLAVETRPDCVSPDEALRLRRLGCTKVQLGIQSLSDEILSRNRRGHGVAASRSAMTTLRRAGFKIHAHWMPNLLGATPQSDVRDFARLFDDPGFRPDELKIYPCSLIGSAELVHHFECGEWRPYEHQELLTVLTSVLVRVPRYCRTTRVIRDFSSPDIVAGNKRTNFRELAEGALQRRGLACRDIRSREIRTRRVDAKGLVLRETSYTSGVGRECFLELVTPEDRIAAFLRLTLPAVPSLSDETVDSAVVREVHVYGVPVGVGSQSQREAQHRGAGRRLLAAARLRAERAGFRRLSVISAVGTRAYYRKLGFEDGTLYQHLSLAAR